MSAECPTVVSALFEAVDAAHCGTFHTAQRSALDAAVRSAVHAANCAAFVAAKRVSNDAAVRTAFVESFGAAQCST